MEATQPIDRLKTKVLECSTATEQVLHVILGDADGDELEVLQSREKKSGRVINGGKWQLMNLASRGMGTTQSANGGSKCICPSLKLSSSR